MKHYDSKQVSNDIAYRFKYLSEFMGFTEEDIDLIRGSADRLAPKVPAIVDAVYDKLHSFDITWKYFLPRNAGFKGQTAETLDSLTLDHPQIKFRKEMLGRYLKKVVTAEYDEKFIKYVDHVGAIHTPAAGAKSINVPLVHMNALMGFVSDALTGIIPTLGYDDEHSMKLIRAFNKLLWIQNDFISRHYDGADPYKEGSKINNNNNSSKFNAATVTFGVVATLVAVGSFLKSH